MHKNQKILNRKKLVIAMSLAIVGGTMGGCSSSNSGGDDTTSTSTIEINGGLGGAFDFAQGGDGGELRMEEGGAGGGVEIRKTGTASASITPPETPTTVNLGSNPLLVTSNTLIETPILYTAIADAAGALAIDQLYVGIDSILRSSVAGGVADYTNDAAVADGSFYRSSVLPDELYQALGDDATPDLAPADMGYFRDNSTNIYITDSDDTTDDPTATGLSVAAGSTLSLASNSGCNTRLNVNNDIDNSGVIQKALKDACELNLGSSNYFATGDVNNAGDADNIGGGDVNIGTNSGITNSGNINVNGFDAVETDSNGGSGGDISLNSSAFIINSGQLSATGGDGLGTGAGGSGGSVDVSNASYTENSGAIDVSGGNNTAVDTSAANGGSGGYVYLAAYTLLNNTVDATISTNGGNGVFGGSARDIELYQSNTEGALLNAGSMSANGGAGSDSSGGDGGEIFLNTRRGGQIQSNAELSSTGGTSAADDSNGGDGGEVIFFADYGNIGPGDIVVSGNIILNGGDALATGNGSGGDGGELLMYNDVRSYNNNSGQRVALLGYSAVNGDGGDGFNGGAGARNDGITLQTRADGDKSEGSIVNDVSLNARGGNSTASGTDSGSGGSGGEVDMRNSQDIDDQSIDVTITNNGGIDVSGGIGYNGGDGGEGGRGGRGGYIGLGATYGVENNASLTANAGDAGDGGEFGGNGGYIQLDTQTGTATNKAAISANGSQGASFGGSGGGIYMYGTGIVNSAALSVNGGNATDATTATGGDGGEIGLFTNDFSAPTGGGSFSYSFGTGVTQDGDEGNATVNLICEGNCTGNNINN